MRPLYIAIWCFLQMHNKNSLDIILIIPYNIMEHQRKIHKKQNKKCSQALFYKAFELCDIKTNCKSVENFLSGLDRCFGYCSCGSAY